MRTKLALSVDEQTDDGLHRVIGRRRISRFIEALVRPQVTGVDLEAGYRRLAADEGSRDRGHAVDRGDGARRGWAG